MTTPAVERPPLQVDPGRLANTYRARWRAGQDALVDAEEHVLQLSVALEQVRDEVDARTAERDGLTAELATLRGPGVTVDEGKPDTPAS